MSKKLKWVFLLSFILQASCQTSFSSNARAIASDEVVEEYEKDFLSLFNRFKKVSESSDAKAGVEYEEILSDEIFAKDLLKGIQKSYYYLYEYDRKLEALLQKCLAQRRAKKDDSLDCEDTSEIPDYKKLIAYRAINEAIKDKITYYYLRLTDLANSTDNKLSIVLPETKDQLASLSAAELSRVATLAALIKSTWDSLLRDKISISNARNVMDYNMGIELFQIKEAAQLVYSQLSGKPFKASSMIRTEDFTQYYEKNIESFKKEAQRSATEEEIEGFDEILTIIKDRSPQSASFVNFTGKSFPRGQWALTYDDGPRADSTNQLLDLLSAAKTHATFFWLAKNAQSSSNQQVIQKAKNLGMGLAHHSYSHANLGKSSANLDKEISQAKRVLEGVYGVPVHFFRLPYGSGLNSARVKNIIAKENLWNFFWNVDSLDWKDPSPKSTFNRVVKQMSANGRGIILFHDIHQKTVATTKILLDYFKKSEHQVKPLSELVGRPAN